MITGVGLYRCRNGYQAEVKTGWSQMSDYPFRGTITGYGDGFWDRNGKFYQIDDGFDIVEPYETVEHAIICACREAITRMFKAAHDADIDRICDVFHVMDELLENYFASRRTK